MYGVTCLRTSDSNNSDSRDLAYRRAAAGMAFVHDMIHVEYTVLKWALLGVGLDINSCFASCWRAGCGLLWVPTHK